MKRRIRHHVNPLAFRGEVERPDWAQVFQHPQRPLEVDVGCAKGEFLLARAQALPEVNFVGLEIRRPMVERVRAHAARLGLRNLHVICCSANAELVKLLAGLPVRLVTIHFPDPWFKQRHHKRRIIQPAFLDALAAVLVPGGELHVMTDYEEHALEVEALLEAHPRFENVHGQGTRAPASPTGVLTDREALHLARGDPIHRFVYRLAERPPA